MTNKKGALFHWVALVILLAGLYVLITVQGSESGRSPGDWHNDFTNNFFYQAEKYLLEINLQAYQAAAASSLELANNGGYHKNSPCGVREQINLWNLGEKLCFPDAATNFNSTFNDEFTQPYTYDVIFSGEEVVGKTKGVITINDEQGLSSYSRNTNFRFPLGYNLEEYDYLTKKSLALLGECIDQQLLAECIKQHQPDNWKANDCLSEINVIGRQALFCVKSEKSLFTADGQQEATYLFGLDFSNS